MNRLREHPQPTISQRVDYLLQEAFHQQERVDDLIDFNHPRFAAATYSQDRREVIGLLALSKEKGWIDYYVKPTSPEAPRNGRLTLSGFVAVEGMTRIAALGDQGFVAMWFDPVMAAVRHEGMMPAIRDAGYTPMLIDRKEHIRKIDDEIVAEIRRSRFIVADFTHGDDGARSSVYYEAGFAEGIGIPVIGTCRKDMVSQIHFDRRQYNHVLWTTPAELRSRLATRIAAVIGDGPRRITS